MAGVRNSSGSMSYQKSRLVLRYDISSPYKLLSHTYPLTASGEVEGHNVRISYVK